MFKNPLLSSTDLLFHSGNWSLSVLSFLEADVLEGTISVTNFMK